MGRMMCKEMSDNFLQKESECVLYRRTQDFQCEIMVKCLPSDIIHLISVFYGRHAIYKLSVSHLFPLEQIVTDIPRFMVLPEPNPYFVDFVRNRIQGISLEFLSKIMNREYDSTESAVTHIAESIVRPSLSARFFTGKVLHIKLLGFRAKYQTFVAKKRAPHGSNAICVDCKALTPIERLVKRHDFGDLRVIKNRCFECDAPIAKAFRLPFKESPYRFTAPGAYAVRCM
jgi:hypothetical protein